MLGWSRIFFMDDDVRGVSLADLRATVLMLDRYRTVGMRVTDYADNSVVCHANRETGADQDVFVSGSVLAVNCQQPFGFFPEIYNEDWLFFYDDVRTRRLGWSGRDVTQLRYDPFENVGRAEGQEFGDVLAEGMYALIHLGSGVTEATVGYRNKFLTTRKKVLEQIIERADWLHLKSDRISSGPSRPQCFVSCNSNRRRLTITSRPGRTICVPGRSAWKLYPESIPWKRRWRCWN